MTRREEENVQAVIGVFVFLMFLVGLGTVAHFVVKFW